MEEQQKDRRLRILLSSNAPWVNSGYSVEARDLMHRWVKDGWKAAMVGFAGLSGAPIEMNGYPIYPAMAEQFGGDAIYFHGKHFDANVIIPFQDIWTLNPQYLQQLANEGRKVICYVPIDQDPVPPNVLANLAYMYKIITLSKFGQKSLLKNGFTSTLIPEGTDTEIFKPMDKKECRKMFGIPEDAFVIGMVGANKENPPRKGWQQALEAFKLFHDKHPEALFWYETNQNAPGGFPVVPYAKYLGIDKYLCKLDDYLSVFHADSLVMAKLYNSFDFLSHASLSEGFGLCLWPEMRLFTPTGLKKIKNFKVGDEVLTHEGNIKKVTEVFKRKTNKGLYEISLVGKPDKIYVTAEHPFWSVKRKDKIKLDIPQWNKAEILRKGDLVAFSNIKPIYKSVIFDLKDFDKDLLFDDNFVWYKMGYSGINGKLKKIKRFIPLNEEMARVIGLYIAEGSTNKNQMSSIEFSFGLEPELVSLVIETLNKYFEVNPKIIDEGTKLRVHASGKIIAKFFSALCGLGAANKHIPEQILFNHNRDIIESCFDYIAIGDAWCNKDAYSFHIASELLCRDIYLASCILGWMCSVRRQDNEEYYAYITKKSGRVHSNKSWIKDNIVYSLIKDVRKIDYEGEVFNLEVEDDHSYLTWGASLHNCIVESQACGIPVVVNDCQSMPELVIPEKTGLICKTGFKYFTNALGYYHFPDTNSLYEKYEQMYRSDRQRMGKAAREHIVANYNIDTIVKEHWIPFFEELQGELLGK